VGRRHPDHDRHLRSPLPPTADYRRGRAAGAVGGVRACRVRRGQAAGPRQDAGLPGGTRPWCLLGVYSLVRQSAASAQARRPVGAMAERLRYLADDPTVSDGR
jgi:hypothetical protein